MTSPATATHYTTEDYKKYIFAEGRAYITRIGDVIETLNEHHDLDQNYEDLTCMLDQAICYLKRAAFADCDGQPLRTVEEVSTFNNGRPVSTTVHFDEKEGDQYIEHAWHPEPGIPTTRLVPGTSTRGARSRSASGTSRSPDPAPSPCARRRTWRPSARPSWRACPTTSYVSTSRIRWRWTLIARTGPAPTWPSSSG